MKPVIEQIYFGETASENIELTKEYHKRVDIVIKNHKALCNELSEEQQELLEQYIDAVDALNSEMIMIYYKHSLSLGLRLGAEVFGEQ